MEDRVSLLEKTIINSINELFSTLPFGAYSTDSEFNSETGELVIIGEYQQQMLEGKSDNIIENPTSTFMSFISQLDNYLTDNNLIIREHPEFHIGVEHSVFNNTIFVEVKCTVRQ